MKWIALGFTLVFSWSVQAAFLKLKGTAADEIVQALLPFGFQDHEEIQTGVAACTAHYDDRGDYFPNGKIGDYVGESCVIYGYVDGTDDDGALRVQALIPAEDQNLTENPKIREQLKKLENLRKAYEKIVQPRIRSVQKDGQETIVERMVGISGFACDGHSPEDGARLCTVKTASICPPR